MIRIYDGNNYYRRVLETDQSGMAPRVILSDTINCPDVQIWVWDGENANARRRELFPDYKRNRKPVRTDIYAGFDVVKRTLTHTRAFQLEIPTYEGDDVVATLARRYASGGNQVAIYSTDYDFVQLTGEYPDHIFCGAKLKPGVDGRLVRHYKSWVGDPSDNIPGIVGFGEVTWSRTPKDTIRTITNEIISGEDFIGDDSLSSRVCSFLGSAEGRALFRSYWDIVGFYEVPDMLIDKHLIQGVEDYQAADQYLKQWFQ